MANFSWGPMKGRLLCPYRQFTSPGRALISLTFDYDCYQSINQSIYLSAGLLRDLDNRNSWTLLKGRESLIAGAGAGLVSSIVTCPLDVVKTKLQAQGVTPAVGSTSRNVEGVMGKGFHTRATHFY